MRAVPVEHRRAPHMSAAEELAEVAGAIAELDAQRATLVARRNRLIRLLATEEERSTRNIAELARVSAMTVSLVVNR